MTQALNHTLVSTLAQAAAPAASPAAIPAWGLWLTAVIGLAFMVVSIVRNSRKVVRSGDEPPASEPQRRWLASRKPKSAKLKSANPAHPALAAAASDLLAQIDQRTAALEQLITLADQRIESLRHASNWSGSAAPRSSAAELKPGIQPSTHNTRTSQVYRLADEGRTPQQIAQDIGVAIGEINLVLALRN